MATSRRVSPGGVSALVETVPDHKHARPKGDGGDLPDYLRLSRRTDQTLSGALLGTTLNLSGGLVLGNDELIIASNGAISLFDGSYIHQLPAPHDMTDGHNWEWPDVDGTFLTDESASFTALQTQAALQPVSYNDDAVFYDGDLVTYG